MVERLIKQQKTNPQGPSDEICVCVCRTEVHFSIYECSRAEFCIYHPISNDAQSALR